MAVTPKVRDSPPRGPPGETETVPDEKNPANGGEKPPPTGAAKGASIAFVRRQTQLAGAKPLSPMPPAGGRCGPQTVRGNRARRTAEG